MKFAYADPPYLGLGANLYDEHPQAGLWDDPQEHIRLLWRLRDEYPGGWAVSCNPRDLALYTAHAHEPFRVAAWVKTYHQIRVNVSVQYAWEPVIFHGGRAVLRRKPLARDWHMSGTHMSDPSLIGSKPPAFCRWVLDLLGFDPAEDSLDDLFPGSGVMGRVIDTYSRQGAMFA